MQRGNAYEVASTVLAVNIGCAAARGDHLRYRSAWCLAVCRDTWHKVAESKWQLSTIPYPIITFTNDMLVPRESAERGHQQKISKTAKC